MSCPTILIADTNEKYLRTLELKFLEELGGKINLHIVSEPEYLKSFFSEPRTIDVLIIDEGLYEGNLCSFSLHNITRIFVLTEAGEKSSYTGDYVKYLHKFSSTKGIFREVSISLGREAADFQEEESRTKVVLITSASGGTGKTVLALGLAGCLARREIKALYVDAEQTHCFGRWLADDRPLADEAYACFQRETADGAGRLKEFLRKEGFDYLPPFKAAVSTLNIPDTAYSNIIQGLAEQGSYEVIIVDTDSVLNEEKIGLISIADFIIISLKQDRSSVYAVNKMLKNIRVQAGNKFLFVCSDYRSQEGNALIASDLKPQFTVSEYIRHMENFDGISLKDMENSQDIRKISYLIY